MQELDAARIRRLIWLVVALAAGWSLLFALAAAFWGGGALPDGTASIGPMLATVTVALFAMNHLLRFVRWQLMLRAEGQFVPWRRSLSIFMAGLALLPTPAKAGVAARSLLLLSEGVPAHVSLAAYFAERLLDLVGLLILASVLLGGAVALNRWILASSVAAAGMVLIVAAPAALRASRARVERFPRLARPMDWLIRCFADAAEMLAAWRLPVFLAIGMAANFLSALILWIAVHGPGRSIELSQATGVLAVSHLSGSISLLPAGLGGFELAMLTLLSSMGIDAPDALRAMWLVRMVTLWGSVAVGLPLLAIGLRRVLARRAAH
ncbi:MAG TPA: lysylphosphatidylglycerol synthase transmembrane domain-containing protein [Burkholderiales bacterium]